MGDAATHPDHQQTPSETPIFSPRRGRTRCNLFPKGSKVEVKSSEEDYKGVYFTATVLRSPKKTFKSRSRSLYVKFDNLLVHENRAERLKEHAKLSDCRPEPPPIPVLKPFEPDDIVDVFHKDGWWPGVVTRVIEGGQRYIVTFSCPPDELEVAHSDLRVHSDWVNGIWVRPQKQRIAGLMFCVGRKVEVSFDRENCRDAWFQGTIQEDLENGTFLVEYSSASTEPVKETVKYPHIRPCPPLLKNRNFDLLEKVDAFFDCGWWAGVVTKEHENGRYTVFFKQMKRDKNFNQSELRPHVEWKDGKWFTSSQLMQGVPVLSVDVGMHEHHKPDNPSPIAVTIPLDCLDDKNHSCDHVIPSSMTTIGRRSRNANEKVKNCIPSSVNGSSVQISELENHNLKVEAKESDAMGNVVAVRNEHGKNNTEGRVILGLPCAEIGNLECATKVKGGCLANIRETKSLTNDKKRQVIVSTAYKRKGNKKLESEEHPERRKRGRPKKIPLESIQFHSPVTGNAQDGVVCSGDLTGASCSDKIPEVEGGSLSNPEMTRNSNKSNDGSIDPKNGTGGKRKRVPLKMHSEKAIEESTRREGVRSSTRGRRLTGGGALQVTDPVDESGGKVKEVNQAMETDTEVCEAPNKDFEDEPLSKWIEGIQSPPSSSNGSRPSPAATINQCMENAKDNSEIAARTSNVDRQLKSGENTPALAATGSIVSSEAENLPFVKNTFLWQTIESMEVFRRMPQKPHFKPLEDFGESSREGLAIGYMVTFSSVVERACRFQHDDPESVTDDIMKTVADLERHGFNVKVVRDCIAECLELRKLQKKMVGEVKMLKDKMLEHKQEFSGIEEELKQLQEKIALAEATKERIAGEIASLEAETTSREEVMKKLVSDFQTVASSLLH